MNEANGHKTDPDHEAIENANHEAFVEKERAKWLDGVMKWLLPELIYKRCQHTSYEKFVQDWMTKNQIGVAVNGDQCVVLREGKILASWTAPEGKHD